MKMCFKCGAIKPISEYYKHKQMADGHLNKCKDCTKDDVKRNRDKNLEYYKNYDSWRFQNDPKVKDRINRYSLTENCKKSTEESKAKWIRNNPNKRAAHVILGNSIKSGRIIKPDHCSICGKWTPSRRLHAHHEDYSRPLDVVWACANCHKDIHVPKDVDFKPKRLR